MGEYIWSMISLPSPTPVSTRTGPSACSTSKTYTGKAVRAHASWGEGMTSVRWRRDGRGGVIRLHDPSGLSVMIGNGVDPSSDGYDFAG